MKQTKMNVLAFVAPEKIELVKNPIPRPGPTESTFRSCMRVLKPGGTLSTLGVYSQDIHIPVSAFYAGLGDQKLIFTLCPGGKERMRRLIEVISGKRVELKPLVTHRFKLKDIVEAYDLFGNRRDGVLKVAVTP